MSRRVFAGLLLILPSCQADDASIEAYTVRDSAGIRITTVHASPDALPEWSLASPPVLYLDGNSEPFFQGVTSAAKLSDGAVIVLDRPADQLHVFDPSGTYMKSLGRPGDGPGEFGNIATLTVAGGDSIFVFDRSHDRVTVFHPVAGFVRDLGVAPDSAGIFPIDVWTLGPNQFALYTEREDLSWIEGHDGQPFVGRVETLLSVYDGEGTRVAGPIVYATGRYAQFSWGAGGLPLYPRPAIAGAAGQVIVGVGNEWHISILDTGLEPLAFLRWPGNHEPITDADLTEVREHMEATFAPLGRDRLSEIMNLSFSEEAVPDALPAHGRILAGRDGSVWISRFEPFREENLWYVFDSNGAPLGQVGLPESSRLLAADTSSIIFMRPDSLDVQSVYVVDLVQPGT